jgi:hypothetical protein
MSGQASVDDNFTFVGGLNTEGGYFITPKNSWVEGTNMVPQRDGSIERRPALVFENDYVSISTATATEVFNNAYTAELWENVGGDGNRDWMVVQVGATVVFLEASPVSTSSRSLTGSVNGVATTALSFDLTPYQCFGNDSVIAEKAVSVTSAYGNLVITHEDCEPILVVWRENNNLTIQKMKLQIRDFKGLPSPLADDQERTQAEWQALGFKDEALYNLYNQGWKDTEINKYVTANRTWPANTKQWFQGKDTNDDFDASVLNKIDFGTSRAPRGRFILEAFYEDRGAATNTNANLTGIGSANGGMAEDGRLTYFTDET